MRVLVVLAHPRRASFTRSVADRLVEGLTGAGHEVEVADLYREGFQPVFTDADHAQFEGGRMGDDILREQERIERSDGLVLVFPVWWRGRCRSAAGTRRRSAARSRSARPASAA